MPKELEAKVRVPSHDAVREALRTAGAQRQGSARQVNRFFDTPGRDLKSRGCGLRVRIADNGAALTFKGPFEAGPFKQREELETEVGDGEILTRILLSTGWEVTFEFGKLRETWLLSNCHVELDDVPGLGMFVEVEGPDEATIRDVLSRIGLADLPVIKQGYVELLLTARGPS
jgi:adenylate cyclase class 2